MLIVNETTDDLISSCMKLLSLNYVELCLIYHDVDTELLNYIFTDHKRNYVKVKVKVSDLNYSISSIFPMASFLEKKISKIYKIEFKNQELPQFKENHLFEHRGIKIRGVLDNGSYSKADLHLDYKFQNTKYISFDSLLEFFSEFENHSNIYQIMALSAFEGERQISESFVSSRMLLIEFDKIKYFSYEIDDFILRNGLNQSSLHKMVCDFLNMNILKKNLLDTSKKLFSEDIIKEYSLFFKKVRQAIARQRRLLLSKTLNKLELKNFIHPPCIYSKYINGTLARSTGKNIDFNFENKNFFYDHFGPIRPKSNEKSEYSYFEQVFYDMEKSLDICLGILDSTNYSDEVFESYSSYDLNNINSDVCYQLETGHGLATLSLYKDETNKLNFQLIPESLRRLYYYQENFLKYDFAMHKRLFDALNINYSEIF